MDARDLDRLLRPISAPREERGTGGVSIPEGISAGVMERIGKGWDPWREDLTAWMKRYWPLGIAAAALATAGLVMRMPHGRHDARADSAGEAVAGENLKRGPLLGQWP